MSHVDILVLLSGAQAKACYSLGLPLKLEAPPPLLKVQDLSVRLYQTLSVATMHSRANSSWSQPTPSSPGHALSTGSSARVDALDVLSCSLTLHLLSPV